MSCRKVGKTVFASARQFNIDVTANGAFFNIPSGFRPKVSAKVMGYMLSDGSYYPLIAEIGTNGNVTLSLSNSRNAQQVGFAGCFTLE